MKNKVDSGVHFPSISEMEEFLKEPIDISIDKAVKPKAAPTYSEKYKALLNSEIWENAVHTIDDLINGKDIIDAVHHSTTPTTSLRNQVNSHLDKENMLIIQLVEDCGHRLDYMEKNIEHNIAGNSLTSSEYMKVKRSSDVIKEIFFIVTSRIEHHDEHALQERTKNNIKQMMQMEKVVDEHLDIMLSAVNKEELKADRSAWLPIALVVMFAFLYMSSFFALDTEKTAGEQILYFFGVR